MNAAGARWSHDVWKHEDERRFRYTLGISLAIHAAVLLAWKLPPPAWKVADAAVLTVVFRGAAPAVQVPTPAPELIHDASVIVQADPSRAEYSVSPRVPLPRPVVPATPRSLPATAGEEGRRASKVNPGRVSNAPPAAVGVAVMLVIGSDGRANQIYWDQLPALTDEQLRRVERTIRARNYTPGQTVTEVIDVREILKLQPARGDDNPLPDPEPVAPGPRM